MMGRMLGCLRILAVRGGVTLLLCLYPFAVSETFADGLKRWATLRIASEGARPPYNFLDNNNDLAGFEIDLGKELCGRMHLKCSFVQQDWDGMIPGLVSDHYDAIMAAMEITDERSQKIGFTKPYIRMPSAFVIAQGGEILDPSPQGLAGKTIGVEAGGPHEAYLRAVYQESQLHTYATLEEAVLDLAQDRVDIAFGDKDAVMDFLANRKEGHCCRWLADIGRDPNYFGDGIAVGLRKEDGELKDLFDKAIDEVVADGTYARLRARYFDFEIY
jgi:polar amino acid transport system substrate-binding protein